MRNAKVAPVGQPSRAALPTQQQWQACVRPLSPSHSTISSGTCCGWRTAGWSRFGCPASDAVLSAYGAGIDGSDTVVLGYFATAVRGAALLCSPPAAFSRETRSPSRWRTAWQGKGIARR